MSAAVNIPIVAEKRVPFDDNIVEIGVDYSGGAAAMQVRQNPGDQGTPLINLGMIGSGSEGLSLTYDPDYEDPRTGEVVGATILGIKIAEATMEGLPYSGDRSVPLQLHYDIQVTPSGGTKFVFCEGTFTINPGVTL